MLRRFQKHRRIDRVALELNLKCDAGKSLMRGTKNVGITSFQRHLVRKCEPDLRNRAKCVLLGVVAQLGAKAKKIGRIVSPSTACLQRRAVATDWNLRREIEREVELAK